jgi:glycosyltransferase involved in cell wall biosynthesis
MNNFKSGQYIKQTGYRSFQPEFINTDWSFTDNQMLQLLSKADRIIGRLDMYSNHVDIDQYIRLHIAKEATTSSKIEGTQTKIQEVFLDKDEIKINKRDDWEEVQAGIERDQQKWSLSDLILVPSQFVYDSVTRLGAEPERVKIVPYGIDSNWLEQAPSPQKGRVLFVGSVGLRKGNHYLAQATRLLKERGITCEVRVIGPYEKGDSSLIEDPEFKGPYYVGQVPRSEVRKEFLQADIFVLPTLSDSFALVHLEAMACAVPVITTPNCGSVVRDGVDGFIIPIRDAESLANRIEQLLTDRQLRNHMSVNAKERAREFTWDQYRDRLLNAFKELESTLNG